MSESSQRTACGLPFGGCGICSPDQSDRALEARAIRDRLRNTLGPGQSCLVTLLKRVRGFQLQYQEGSWEWGFWAGLAEETRRTLASRR